MPIANETLELVFDLLRPLRLTSFLISK